MTNEHVTIAFKETVRTVLDALSTSNTFEAVVSLLSSYARVFEELEKRFRNNAFEEFFNNGDTSTYYANMNLSDLYEQKIMLIDRFIFALTDENKTAFPIGLNELATDIAIRNKTYEPMSVNENSFTYSSVKLDSYNAFKDVTRYALRVLRHENDFYDATERMERMEHLYWDIASEAYDRWYAVGDYDAYNEYLYYRVKANMLDTVAREIRVSKAYPTEFYLQAPLDTELIYTPIEMLA